MKILIVDDEPLVGSETNEYLSSYGYSCHDCTSFVEALALLQADDDIRVIITDLQMPNKNGFDLISAAQALNRNFQFIIITGKGGRDDAISAVRCGVSEFLTKPINHIELVNSVKAAVKKVESHDSGLRAKAEMRELVASRERRIVRLLGNLDSSYTELTFCLATAAEYKDPDTGQHISRIGNYSALIAKLLGWPDRDVEMIRLAAPLHDIGKIGTPDQILLKAGKLNDIEVSVMQTHSSIGYEILSRSTSPVLSMAANIAIAHHEKWDGSGYPNGLCSSNIPIEALITAVGDVYDALRSERPYKPPVDHHTACKILIEGDSRTKPSHFSPDVLAIFENNHNKFDQIYGAMKNNVPNELIATAS